MNNWKQKLADYLHDPPSKCLDIRTHGDRSDAAFRQAGFVDEAEIGKYFSHADHTAAAADRLPFPGSRSSGMRCVFDGVRNVFRHPLSGQGMPFHKEFASVEQGFDGEASVQPALSQKCLANLPDEDIRWRARFFAHWRLWPKFAMERDYRLGLLPADTRIPDHSIWTHMQVVSALGGCVNEDKKWQPAFLKFQLGPVQDFIAAARSVRDLWSGSYLLSWLMAAGLKALSAEVGPDAVIFPNLRDQPLFDLHWKEELWDKVSINDQECVWNSLGWKQRELLTPNLPNVLLAVVPADRGGDLGALVEKAIQAEWKKISSAVWNECSEAGLTADEDGITEADRKKRFDQQVERFLSCSWQVTPWPKTLDEALKLADGFADDLRLMSVAGPDELPGNGMSLVVVAWINEQLHIRIFNSDSKMVVDKAESDLVAGSELAELKELLGSNPFPDIYSLSASKKAEIIDNATSIAGHTHEMPVKEARKRVRKILEMATKQMPVEHRDGRFYDGGNAGPKEKLNNVGLGWSIVLAVNSWGLDAVRQTRAFTAVSKGGWSIGPFNNKDALTGREEAVAGGRIWAERAKEKGAPWSTLFKHEDWLGATTLVKRLWHRAYLAGKPWALKTDSHHFPMPNTRGIAGHQPEHDCEGDESSDDASPSEKYFAVLAFDGDEIGKWVSGQKTPKFETQLADYQDGSGNPGFGSKPYFSKDQFAGFLDAQRPVSPSYHLQFSEALGNFAMKCAGPIVEAFDGRLIYAGGDDVVALIPADSALDCAVALRLAFTGALSLKDFLHQHATVLQSRHDARQKKNPKAPSAPYYQKLAAESCLLDARVCGFVQRLDHVDQNDNPIPFVVPGPKADCSVGISIAHFKSPLQDAVKEAQRAEKRAKRGEDMGGLNRSAVAVTLMKRSGEILEWGTKWDSGGLTAYSAILDALRDGIVSAKFPHRVEELVAGYQSGNSKATGVFSATVADQVLRHEIGMAAERQRGGRYDSSKVEELQKEIGSYLESLDEPDSKIDHLIGLCRTVAFAHRTAPESDHQSSQS